MLNPRRHPPVAAADAAQRPAEHELPAASSTTRQPTDVDQRRPRWSCTCSTRRSGTAWRMSASCSTPTATACPSRSTTTATAPARTCSGPTDPRRCRRAPARCRRNARTTAAHALGIENMAEHCVQGRGVMIDLHAHFGRARVAVGYDQLMRVLEADRVVVEHGDMVCLHTGFAQMLLEMGRQARRARRVETLCAVLDGRDAQAAAMDHRHRAGGADRRQLRGRSASGHQRTSAAAPRCRCTSTACSSSACTSARSGT